METVKSVLRMGLVLAGLSFVTACGSLVEAPWEDGSYSLPTAAGRVAPIEQNGSSWSSGMRNAMPAHSPSNLSNAEETRYPSNQQGLCSPTLRQTQTEINSVLQQAAKKFGISFIEISMYYQAGELCFELVEEGYKVSCERCGAGNQEMVIIDIS